MKMLLNLLQFGLKLSQFFQLSGLSNPYSVKKEGRSSILIFKKNIQWQGLNILSIKKKKKGKWQIKIEKKVRVINNLLIKGSQVGFLLHYLRNQHQKNLNIYLQKVQVRLTNKKKEILRQTLMASLQHGQMSWKKNQCSFQITQKIFHSMIATLMWNLQHGANIHLMLKRVTLKLDTMNWFPVRNQCKTFSFQLILLFDTQCFWNAA